MLDVKEGKWKEKCRQLTALKRMWVVKGRGQERELERKSFMRAT